MTVYRRQLDQSNRRVPPDRTRGFTLLELEVAMVILAMGIVGLGSLVTVTTRQMAEVDKWCEDEPTYYLVSQEDPWMQQLGTPANMESISGQSAWTPPVTGDATDRWTLLTHTTDTDTRTATICVQRDAEGS